MIRLSAAIAEPLVFVPTVEVTGGEGWSLLRIQTLTGTVVGTDADGVALVYPLALTSVPNAVAWTSSPVMVASSGKYLALFQCTDGRVVAIPVEVTRSSASSTGGESPSVEGYCTHEQILARVGSEQLAQLTNPESGGDVDWDVVDTARAGADREIDGYCGRRFTVPFDPVPTVINQLSLDITVYRIFEAQPALAEARAPIYKRAVRQLQAIGNGDFVIAVPEPAANPKRLVKVVSNNRVFSGSSMEGL